jgi:hypothetical protein
MVMVTSPAEAVLGLCDPRAPGQRAAEAASTPDGGSQMAASATAGRKYALAAAG